jgi:Ca-activated chloride channel family protein
VRLADPWLLVLLAAVPVVAWLARRRRVEPAVRWSSFDVLRDVVPPSAGRARRVLGALRLLALALGIVALARPQVVGDDGLVHHEGVDVVLAVDVSGSMLAEDLAPHTSRLDAVKGVVREFVGKRPDDRIGLVLFAGRPYTQTPLTLDHPWLLRNLDRARIGMIEDGTAVGSALATAVNRLRASTAPSKFVVLLTDGQSNAGRITPETAADAAAALGIRVYTVGAGTRGTAPYPVRDLFGGVVYRQVPVDVDEETLGRIAARTGGKYFRATDTASLRDVYDAIDRAEKAPFDAPDARAWRELYPWLLWPALALLLLETTLAHGRLRTLP